MYGLPVAGASFRAYLAAHLRGLGYKSCKADPDVHMQISVKKDRDTYYQYMLAYVDNLLRCSEDPKINVHDRREIYAEEGNVEEPSLYLGADIV